MVWRNGEHGYGDTQKDPYGGRLNWVYASSLVPLASQKGIQDNKKMRAIWAYLACLDPETPVALYWS